MNIPTHIITGFLGVGKTTALLSLLEQQPSNQRWAVLVNEFGEIGVDGSLFQGQQTEEQGIYIREVPGGCMCCTAGLPMQIALNQLISRAKPDRLFIEPTGLGHPLEVLETLSSEYYQEVLSIQKIVTLVDARKLSDRRYTEHATFNQQIAIADIIVGNKQDLYSPEDEQRLIHYINEKGKPQADIILTQQGVLKLDAIAGAKNISAKETEKSDHDHDHGEHSGQTPSININEQAIPESGYLQAQNQGEGYESIGWRFDVNQIFNRNQLYSFLNGLEAERMKAVFITDQGIFGYNLTPDALTEIPLDECMESRIEMIATNINPDWHAQLLGCLSS